VFHKSNIGLVAMAVILVAVLGLQSRDVTP
jgi:hypothetical protein